MIEGQKYTAESDYIHSYINKFITSRFFYKHTSITRDALAFDRCVNMVPTYYKLADCSTRRENIEAFVAENEDKFAEYRTALSNCNSELAQAFSLNRNSDNIDAKPSDTYFIRYKLYKAENALYECVKRNMH
jgi:hypothetical protein